MSDLSRPPSGSADPERHVRETMPAAAQVPRALPYRPPGEVTGGLHRRTLLLAAAGAVVLVALTAGATAFVLNLTAPRSQSPAPDNNDETLAQADKARRSVALKDKGSTAREKKTPLPRTAQEKFLKALGTMSGAHVYQTYLNIGLLADGVESEAYTKAEAEQMLTTVGGMIEMVDRELDRLAELDLSEAEKAGIEVIQNLTGLLRRQGNALRAYWTTGEREQITRYQRAREDTWKELSELLGLE